MLEPTYLDFGGEERDVGCVTNTHPNSFNMHLVRLTIYKTDYSGTQSTRLAHEVRKHGVVMDSSPQGYKHMPENNSRRKTINHIMLNVFGNI